ncbi:HAD family hydrolase [Acidobacteria bacterium AB60]|nr:HAD family hydrolase [Acidobacteria bacterium AB60]
MASSPVTVTCQGVLFDMDGILISSLGSVERSWTRWSQMRGVDPAHAISVIHGRRAIESLTALRPDLNGEEELEILEQFEVDDTADIAVLPGVQELIASLPPDQWTVVTSATDRLARVRLASAGIPIPRHFVNGNSVSEGKPNPAPYLAGAALLGLSPQDCVVFEDSGSGVQAGHAAGCTVIATMFAHESQDLSKADYLVRDLTGIKAVVDQSTIKLSFLP